MDQERATSSRRDFLRLAGFTAGALAVGGCSRAPERGVMPYLVRPEEVTPGRPTWYATVCGGCAAGCGVLAACRDGRPVKLEGNPDHPLSRGGLCAAGQASVLALYDSKKLRRPLDRGHPSGWDAVDKEIGRTLEAIRAGRGRVRFLTDSGVGPAERARIAAFLGSFADGRHVIYDPVSCAAVAQAHGRTHGLAAVPRYRLHRARVIVGFEVDFLGGWIAPVEHTAGYAAGRRLAEGDGAGFSHHIQFEARMSLTGSKADRRVPAPAGASALLLAHLTARLARRAGAPPPWRDLPACPVDAGAMEAAADALWAAPRGRSLVLCGENDLAAQLLANEANRLLGNYGDAAGSTTIDLESVSSRGGDDAALRTVLDEVESGRVDALFVRGVNPVYDLPEGERLGAALDGIGLVVSVADSLDETAHHARFVCPEPHFLESWGDAEPAAGTVTVRQPVLRTLGATRPLLESLAAWEGRPAAALDQVRAHWRARVYPRRRGASSFEEFWNRALHDGFAEVGPEAVGRRATGSAGAGLPSRPPAEPEPEAGTLALVLHPSHGILDGRHAHNPWLHELPDPITKTVWDNVAALAPAFARERGIATGDVVRLTPLDGAAPLELPALVQPGQHGGAVAVGLGYGRAGTDRFAGIGPSWWEGRPTVAAGQTVGVNAAPLVGWAGGRLAYAGRRVRVEKTGRRRDLARTQAHHSLQPPARVAGEHAAPRPMAREMTLAGWLQGAAPGSRTHGKHPSLWPDHPKGPHHWGMAIDLTACTGCSACVIACQAENNIPVVGRDEVRRAREMHWMRIDRYYGGEENAVDVVHMPMLCQHCDKAPCETVCPVQATAQSAEGLNQQIYNRCVGTRYCANNCPYKVRRFNWFAYPREDRLQNLALNPEVTVRSRGVMEKCSFCVQRIQDAKAEARRQGRSLRDGEIQPACAQSCPAGAIVFGDTQDTASRVAAAKRDPRHYTVLEELGVEPVVGYLALVRHRRGGKGGEGT